MPLEMNHSVIEDAIEHRLRSKRSCSLTTELMKRNTIRKRQLPVLAGSGYQGKRPLVLLADCTTLTPIAMAAMRCGMRSRLARVIVC